MSISFFRNHLFFDWLIPIVLLLCILPFSEFLDLSVSNYFYDPINHHFSQNAFFKFIYKWGVIPGQILGVGAGLAFVCSLLSMHAKKWRKASLMVTLTVAIGSGFIVHVPLKEYWKRPRPRQIEQFGGHSQFRSFYQPNFGVEGSFKSFPSGHAAIGFCFFALAIQGRRTGNIRLFWCGLMLALGLGVCLGWTRIAQGAHFFSDILVSACIMWVTAATCDYFIYDGIKYAYLQNELPK